MDFHKRQKVKKIIAYHVKGPKQAFEYGFYHYSTQIFVESY